MKTIIKIIRGKLSEVEKAYIAGLIDGEGNIGIHRHTDNRGKSKLHRLALAISNNNPQMHKFLIKKLGGIVTARQQQQDWNINYVYKAQTSDLQYILESVLPYLILKKKQAILGLKFLASKQKYALSKNCNRYSHPLTIKEQMKREGFYVKMRILNQQFTKPKPHQILQPQRLNEKTREIREAIV